METPEARRRSTGHTGHGAQFNILNGADPKNDFGIDMELPKEWWDTAKHPELWEAYVIPAIQQLRQAAAARAHGAGCECAICSGDIDEPTIVAEGNA